MKNHKANHLIAGFYQISDCAAGALAKLAGKPLPKHGWELPVYVPGRGPAWLTRTARSLWCKRGWVWAIHALPDANGPQFTFEA